MVRREFFNFLDNTEALVEKARLMEWIEENFHTVSEKGAHCRVLLFVATHRKCTIKDLANFLKKKKHSVSPYLKELEEKGILTKVPRGGEYVYMPHFNGKEVGK